MKIRLSHLLFALLLSGIYTPVSAQTNVYYGALGLNQSYTTFDSLNWVLKRYNETHPNLTTELGEFNYLPGLALSGGAGFGNFLLDVTYRSGFGSMKAVQENSPGNEYLQQLRMRTMTINVGIGVQKIEKKPIPWPLAYRWTSEEPESLPDKAPKP